MTHVTGIIGGIGAGKSVVCRVLRALGYPVYDTDLEARRIMDSLDEIHSDLCRLIHPEAVKDRVVNRPLISKLVFADAEKLATLNAIVHGHVKADLQRWIDSQPQRCFVETAIPRSSGLDRMLTDAWLVTADTDCRIRRVMARNGLTADQIIARIRSQEAEFTHLHCPCHVIVNDDSNALLPQINSLL